MPQLGSVPHERYRSIEGAYVSVGNDPDIDSAFDDAAQSARDEYGHAGAVPTVADADPSSVEVHEGEALSVEGALNQALRDLKGGAQGLHALPVALDSQYKRRKVRLNFDDPGLDLTRNEPGIALLTEELEERVKRDLAEAGTQLEEGEEIEQVEVVRVRARYKPEVTVNRGVKERVYQAVIRETGEVIGEGKTAGEARRAAVTKAKEGAAGKLEEYTIDVVQQVRCEGNEPLIAVKRTRVLQKGALRVTLSQVKNPEKLKVNGWLLYGKAAQKPEETEAPEEA